jgi:hypothetical protein
MSDSRRLLPVEAVIEVALCRRTIVIRPTGIATLTNGVIAVSPDSVRVAGLFDLALHPAPRFNNDVYRPVHIRPGRRPGDN